ncbi:MAG: hypothetical protein AB7O64_18590 [Methylibium sp.]
MSRNDDPMTTEEAPGHVASTDELVLVSRVSRTSSGMRIDHIDADGDSVLRIYLWRDPDECSMCGTLGYHSHAVPWYCGPVAYGESEGGYKTVCKRCHDRWEAWDASLRYCGA